MLVSLPSAATEKLRRENDGLHRSELSDARNRTSARSVQCTFDLALLLIVTVVLGSSFWGVVAFFQRSHDLWVVSHEVVLLDSAALPCISSPSFSFILPRKL